MKKPHSNTSNVKRRAGGQKGNDNAAYEEPRTEKLTIRCTAEVKSYLMRRKGLAGSEVERLVLADKKI